MGNIKLTLKRIEHKQRRAVVKSKRRNGLLKKAFIIRAKCAL